MVKHIKTFRKGARVRYIGTDPRMKELCGTRIFLVTHKMGNMVSGYFPTKCWDGTVRCSWEYMVPIKDLEVVTDRWW